MEMQGKQTSAAMLILILLRIFRIYLNSRA